MKVFSGDWESWDLTDGGDVAIGVMDGVHVGHRSVLGLVGEGSPATVVTFDPHPIEVLRPGTHPRLLTTIAERIELFAEVGVDNVCVLDLSQIREMSPAEFVGDVLVDKVRPRRVLIGPDFRFGKDRTGDVNDLVELGRLHGFTTVTVDLVTFGGEVVSSSIIRQMVESGDVSGATERLTAPFRLSGPVVHGDKRGRTIGFPTANLDPPERKVTPADGVYAALAEVSGETHRAAVNVGFRPTFDGDRRVIEAYLLDFDADIYGQNLTIRFVSHLRPELRFSTVDDLVAQMTKDVSQAASILDGFASGI